MTQELWILAWSAVFCLLMWLPYIGARMIAWGPMPTMGYPSNPPPLPVWAQRAQKAHMNMVENLAPFAAIVLVAHAAGVHNAYTEWGAALFIVGRILHYPIYTAGVPVLRTATFAVATVGTLLIFFQLFGAAALRG
jgi:uncharacterized MAPEG superfamily protein